MSAYTLAEHVELASGQPEVWRSTAHANSHGAAPGLGRAWAGVQWHWAQPRAEEQSVPEPAPRQEAGWRPEALALPAGTSAVLIPEALLRLMRAAARDLGRTESALWAEAAREWLARRALDDEPQPPTPAAAALAVPRPITAWMAIDTLLAELRTRPCASPRSGPGYPSVSLVAEPAA